MGIRLYNTLSRQTEEFIPLKAGHLSMYQCGPTVYDTAHIGNFRTFVMDDLVRRVFEYNDYKVTQVMNITDVDDKTIRRSTERHQSLGELTRHYEELFLAGLDSLHVLRPHHVLRATEHITAMIALIQNLLDKGVAYRADDGIYLSIAKVPSYGALAHVDLTKALAAHARIVNDEYDKTDPRDFAVWKFHTAADADVSWPASFGAGRPGWHIECSAMAMEALGPTLDIHTGGSDLIFPHHTNEIAQSEAATGKPFVHYWLHGGFMAMNEEKMAKSKGNVVKLEDLAENMVSPLAFRYWLLTAHYRSPVNFTYEAVRAAQQALIRLIATVGGYPDGGTVVGAYTERFAAAINDDINTPQAVALMWELMKDGEVTDADKRATVLDFDRVFGLSLADAPRQDTQHEIENIPIEITTLAEAREEARRGRDWQKADALRGEIESRGYTVDDTSSGPRLRQL